MTLTPSKSGSGLDTITISGPQVAPAVVQPGEHVNGAEASPTMHADNPFEPAA